MLSWKENTWKVMNLWKHFTHYTLKVKKHSLRTTAEMDTFSLKILYFQISTGCWPHNQIFFWLSYWCWAGVGNAQKSFDSSKSTCNINYIKQKRIMQILRDKQRTLSRDRHHGTDMYASRWLPTTCMKDISLNYACDLHHKSMVDHFQLAVGTKLSLPVCVCVCVV